MQLLDSSGLGLRSARLTFRNSTTAAVVTLFPMVHLGEAAFYEAVYRDAFAHDAVLVEGVRSPVAARITRVYRWIEGAKRIALIVQPRPPEQLSSSAAIIHADLSQAEFERHWRKVPRHQRWFLYMAAPLTAAYFRWFGSRASLAANLALDDLPSRDETLSWTPEYAALAEVILTERDRRLIEAMREYLDLAAGGPPRVAVVYGARHMRAVIHDLVCGGFHCVATKWVLVFPLEKAAESCGARTDR